MAVNIIITGDKELRKKLGGIAAKIKKPEKALSLTGNKLVSYFKDNMESEGVKLEKKRWQKLSPRTLGQKAILGFGNKKMLQRTGRLKRGIKKLSVSKNKLIIGNRVPYYKDHQLGASGKDKVPQRRMLGVNDDVAKIVLTTLKKFITF